MYGFSKEGYAEGLVIIGLTVWVSITLTLMLARSWVAGNAYWVAVLTGLICLSASLSVYTWRILILDPKGVGKDET